MTTESEFDPMNYAKLGEKIQAISKAIGAIQEDGNNTKQSYRYISNAQTIAALRTYSLEHKICIMPSIKEHKETSWKNDKGTVIIRSTVDMIFKIIDLETGFVMEESFAGASNDFGGKSLQQAVTQAVKYYYFKLFNITAMEDIDGDGKEDIINGDMTPDPTEWLIENDKNWKKAVATMAIPDGLEKLKGLFKMEKEVIKKLKDSIK